MAKAIHSMIRVLDEARSVEFYRVAFALDVAQRFDFDSFTLIYLRNAEADFELDAVGATSTFPTPPYPSTHNLGTNRMSAKASDGVVNKNGQAHDIANLFISDGSQFTTGGAENPTLTIVALAIRQADYIAEQMAAGAI